MILYLFKTILCSGFLLLAYRLLLQPEKMLRFNRFYLLFSLLFSFTVPLIYFSVESNILLQPQVITSPSNAGILINVVPENNSIEPAFPVEKPAFNWWYLVAAIYAAGAGVMLFRFGKNIFQLIENVRKSGVQDYSNAKLVLLNTPTIPHSFLHFIFLNKEDNQNGLIKPEVLCHELTHVQQKHSLDIVLIEILLVGCWFNPVLYFYRKAIRLNHEFLADEAVIKSFDDAPSYQHLLLQTATVSAQPFPASSFTYSITKKRFLMMTKNTSSTVAFAKGIVMFSMLAVATFVFSTRTVAQVKDTLKLKQQDGAGTKAKPLANEKEQDSAVLGASYWAKQSIGHTEEGVTGKQLQEYNAIIENYKTEGKWWQTFNDRVSETDRSHLENIFKQMNYAQQSEAFLIFIQPYTPFSKVVPTKAELEAFKNPKVYGLWVNDKHVSNVVLEKYNNTDFSHFFVSKLYGPAKTGRSYTHQLDMMTNEYYQAYYNKTMNDKKARIGFTLSNHPVDSIRQKYRSLNGKPRVHVQMYSSNNVMPPNTDATAYQADKIDSALRNMTISQILSSKKMEKNMKGLMQEN